MSQNSTVRKSSQVTIIVKAGPFQVVSDVDTRQQNARRRYSCENYQTCLNLAAALNWDGFTCRGCSGNVDQNLMWRARHETRNCQLADAISELPALKIIQGGNATKEIPPPTVVPDKIRTTS